MAAEMAFLNFLKIPALVKNESGQSIVELLLAIPLLIGLVSMLVKVNIGMQMGIVNQQYARAHAHFLTFNSPYYPELKFSAEMATRRMNRMVVGVSENVIPADSVRNDVQATRYYILRPGARKPAADSVSNGYMTVINTVHLCTRQMYVNAGDALQSHNINTQEYDLRNVVCQGGE